MRNKCFSIDAPLLTLYLLLQMAKRSRKDAHILKTNIKPM